MKNAWRFTKFLKAILLGCGLVYILIYVLTALARLAYPYELRIMEGGMVDHVLHILAGESLYGPPTLHFVPYAYPPLYYYLAAVIAKLLGVGFFPLRLVSFFASLGIMALIYRFVHRETADRSWALVAVSLFAATYQLSDAWFDLARIDSLYFLFVLLFAYLIRFHPGRIAYAGAALVLFLAVLTKQSALMIALPLMVYAVFFEKRGWPWLLGTSTLLIGGGTLLLNALHHGWYNYYIFDLTGERWLEKLVKLRIIGFWTEDMLKPLATAVFLFLAFLISELKPEKKKKLFYYIAFAGGMIGTSWFSRLEYGAVGNALIPAHAMLAIGFGLALAKFWPGASVAKTEKVPLRNVILFGLALFQFALLAYNPLLLVPTAADRKAGDVLIKTLAGFPGDIMVPGHGFLPYLAGKAGTADDVAVKNLTRIDRGPVKEKLEKEIKAAIESERFSAIILDKHDWMAPLLKRHYYYDTDVFSDPAVFWTPSVKKLRPNFIYLPKKRAGKDTNPESN
jgi:hypothetical protein